MLRGNIPVGTRGSVPQLSPLLVARPRLDEPLSDGARKHVTLVCAPPGAGKTTLLASGLGAAATEQPVAWLSLDERDNDPARLVALLRWALSARGGEAAAPFSLAPPVDLLDDLLGQLSVAGQPQILVLDDLHEVRSRSALEALAHLVRHLPASIDVVLSSRADPAIGLDRLRMDGWLGEIRNDDLAFSQDEAVELLAKYDVALDRDDVRALWARTEGWAAGLRLAACTLQNERDPGRFVRSATQTENVVSDYLLRELLARQDESVQWFLMRTSVAERLSPELAAQLVDGGNAAAFLEDLERCGILVREVGEAGLYRYHSLFGTLLRARLRRHDPDLARDLHSRTAQWCLANEMPIEAERHAREAEDWGFLGRLMSWRWMDASLDGYGFSDGPDSAELDPALLTQVPGLALVAAADACRHADHESAALYRDALDDRLAELAAVDRYQALSWDSERLMLDVAFGLAFGADERSRRASESLVASADERDAAGLRRFGALRCAQLDLDAGDVDTATARLTELADRGDHGWVTVEAAAMVALVHAASGRLAQAKTAAAVVADNSPDHATVDASRAALLATTLVHAQCGEQRHAAEKVDDAMPGTDLGWGLLRHIDRLTRAALSATAASTVALDSGAARHPLVERVLLAVGVVSGVGADGRPVAVGGQGEQALAVARERLHGDDPVGADAMVSPWLATVDRADAHPRTVAEALAVAAVAATARGEHQEAQRRVCDVLDHVAINRTLTPLLRHGTYVAPLLERYLSSLGDRTGMALELLDRMRSTGRGGLVEPLTDREAEVLVHLPTLMSNAEIAADLHLSVNTVKTHLKALYRKLGVDGRRQAVVRGRELELL